MKKVLIVFLLIIVVSVGSLFAFDIISEKALTTSSGVTDNSNDNDVIYEDNPILVGDSSTDGANDSDDVTSNTDETDLDDHTNEVDSTISEDNNESEDTSNNESENDTDNIGQGSDDDIEIINPNIDISEEHIISLVGEEVYNFIVGEVKVNDNPSSLYALVNKLNELPDSYVPSDLVIPDVNFTFEGFHEKKQMRSEAAAALEQLFAGAKEESYDLFAISGYRSYSLQSSIFQSNVDRKGEEEANKTSARPGQSEHQSGLAMDVSAASAGYDLTFSFGETEEGIWLANNAHHYGFIIRYPEDKTEITGYSYEPWHLRYVGIELANYLYNYGFTLDEFYEQLAE